MFSPLTTVGLYAFRLLAEKTASSIAIFSLKQLAKSTNNQLDDAIVSIVIKALRQKGD